MVYVLSTGIVLVMLAYQDFSQRAVSIYVFILLVALLTIQVGMQLLTESRLLSVLLNLSYITTLIIVLSVYFSLRSRWVVNIFNGFIGIGDLLLLMILAIWFETFEFVVFVNISFAASFVFHLLLHRYSRSYRSVSTVPLAGMVALCFFVVLLSSHFK